MVQVKPSLSHITNNVMSDPLRNFKFLVTISHSTGSNTPSFTNFGFMSVSGLNVATEVIPYREGGSNTTSMKIPGQSDFSPITLSTGLQIGKGDMGDWMSELFTVNAGSGTGAPGSDFRATITIKVLDHPVTSTTNVPVKAVFKVYNAWPTSISYGDLDAGANAIIVNQMSLAHEGWEFKLADGTGTADVTL